MDCGIAEDEAAFAIPRDCLAFYPAICERCLGRDMTVSPGEKRPSRSLACLAQWESDILVIGGI